MFKIVIAAFFLSLSSTVFSQNIPARWDELVATDWPLALEKSSRTCILPIGILEKHGPHLPIGADLINVREWAARAAKQEYAVVFPDYFYGQIYEARQHPGTFALPSNLLMELLNATCEEIARNGFNKIIIINGHGGNPDFINFFIQTQLEKKRDYAVYFFQPGTDAAYSAQLKKMKKSDPRGDMHAGENETSQILYLRPELVKLDRARDQSGENQKRLQLPNLYTAIWWYADFPNHYAGEGWTATPEVGKLITENTISSLVSAIKTVKADTKTLELQNEYFDKVDQDKN
jgi:creatinine amidohydrolase